MPSTPFSKFVCILIPSKGNKCLIRVNVCLEGSIHGRLLPSIKLTSVLESSCVFSKVQVSRGNWPCSKRVFYVWPLLQCNVNRRYEISKSMSLVKVSIYAGTNYAPFESMSNRSLGQRWSWASSQICWKNLDLNIKQIAYLKGGEKTAYPCHLGTIQLPLMYSRALEHLAWLTIGHSIMNQIPSNVNQLLAKGRKRRPWNKLLRFSKSYPGFSLEGSQMMRVLSR